MELLEDDDFQKMACNPKAIAIVEEVHRDRDAFRKYVLLHSWDCFWGWPAGREMIKDCMEMPDCMVMPVQAGSV